MIHVPLTEEQLIALEPLFEAVRNGNKKGEKSLIDAQVFTDGLVVGRVTKPKRPKWGITYSSAAQRMEDRE